MIPSVAWYRQAYVRTTSDDGRTIDSVEVYFEHVLAPTATLAGLNLRFDGSDIRASFRSFYRYGKPLRERGSYGDPRNPPILATKATDRIQRRAFTEFVGQSVNPHTLNLSKGS